MSLIRIDHAGEVLGMPEHPTFELMADKDCARRLVNRVSRQIAAEIDKGNFNKDESPLRELVATYAWLTEIENE